LLTMLGIVNYRFELNGPTNLATRKLTTPIFLLLFQSTDQLFIPS